jgi:hypothetical protein
MQYYGLLIKMSPASRGDIALPNRSVSADLPVT